MKEGTPVKLLVAGSMDFKILYRLGPLRLGILIDNEVVVPWRSMHFECFQDSYVFLSEDSKVEFYYFTPLHVFMGLREHQRVYWIKPFDNDLPFHYEERDRTLWNTCYRLLARYHPAQRF